MAAGIINNNVIPLQLVPNHPSGKARFKRRTRMMDNNPHGNKRNVEGLDVFMRICDIENGLCENSEFQSLSSGSHKVIWVILDEVGSGFF